MFAVGGLGAALDEQVHLRIGVADRIVKAEIWIPPARVEAVFVKIGAVAGDGQPPGDEAVVLPAGQARQEGVERNGHRSGTDPHRCEVPAAFLHRLPNPEVLVGGVVQGELVVEREPVPLQYFQRSGRIVRRDGHLVGITEHQRRHELSRRLGHVAHGLAAEQVPVDGHGYRPADLRVGERVGFAAGQRGFEGQADVDEPDAGHDIGPVFGRRLDLGHDRGIRVLDEIDLSGQQLACAPDVVADNPEADRLEQPRVPPVPAGGPERDFAVALVPFQPIGPRAHGIELQEFGALAAVEPLGNDEDLRQLRHERHVGLVRHHADGGIVQHLERLDVDEERLARRAGQAQDALEAVHHVAGGKPAAVVKHDVGPEIDDPGDGIRVAPGRGHPGDHFEVAVQENQRIKEVKTDGVGDLLGVGVRVQVHRPRGRGDDHLGAVVEVQPGVVAGASGYQYGEQQDSDTRTVAATHGNLASIPIVKRVVIHSPNVMARSTEARRTNPSRPSRRTPRQGPPAPTAE